MGGGGDGGCDGGGGPGRGGTDGQANQFVLSPGFRGGGVGTGAGCQYKHDEL